jgi:AraC-like DNA-binding protein
VEDDRQLWSGVSTAYGLTVVEAGAFDFWYRGRVRTQGPGTVKLKVPAEVHRDLRVHAPVTAQGVGLPPALVEALARERGRPAWFEEVVVTPGSPVALAALCLHHAIRDPGSSALLLESLLVAVLEAAWSRGRGEAAARAAPPAVRRAREVLHARFDEEISLRALALEAGLGRYELIRAFGREYGMSPYAYLTHLRVARARELLEAGHTGADAAAAVGLYDQSQLHRHFVRIVGVTPGAYARSVAGR